MLALADRTTSILEKPPVVYRGLSSRLPWVWEGLCVAVPFLQQARDGCRDIVNGVMPTSFTGLAWTRDARGNPVARLGDGAGLRYPANDPRQQRPTSALTVLARVRYAGSSDLIGNVAVLGQGGGSALDPAWQMFTDASGEVAAAIKTSDTFEIAKWSTYTNALTTSNYVSLFLRWRAGGQCTIDVYNEVGFLGGAGDSDLITGTLLYDSGAHLRINESYVGDGSTWNADYSQVLVWNRRLNDNECRRLSSDPFGWCSPRRETVGISGAYLIGSQPFMQVGGRG